jgi:UDP-2,3-diacylglucosamine pyrophosphatase LpxH
MDFDQSTTEQYRAVIRPAPRGSSPTWNYAFVSDLHLSLGYNPERRAYHPREDFFFDEAFFRWVRWLDGQCAPGQRYELVMIGDVFDFLPADEATVGDYLQARAVRRRTIDESDTAQIVRYWEARFAEGRPRGTRPARVEPLLFEDDVLDGHIRLEGGAAGPTRSAAARGAGVPPWAVAICARHDPRLARFAQIKGMQWRLVVDGGEPDARSARPGMPTAAQDARMPRRAMNDEERDRTEEFERRYGFLPTPEKSAQKMAAICRGHPVFFRALAWFVGHGHRVTFARGNHDLELFWPSVQDTIRRCVAQEYASALAGSEPDARLGRDTPNLVEHIRFERGWFCYRRGAFYAEHGCQYDTFSASANPIRPVLPGHSWLMNPDVGSLAVICLHNHLESQFPELENEANYGVSLLGLVRRDPLRAATMLVRHAADFLRMAQRLWLAGRNSIGEQLPTWDDLTDCAEASGLPRALVEAIYDLVDEPLLLRPRLAWLLFSPAGHAMKLCLLLAALAVLAVIAALYYLVLAPAVADLVPTAALATAAGPALRLLSKLLLWVVPPTAYAAVRRRLASRFFDDPLSRASQRILDVLRDSDPGLRFIVMGHSHRPDIRPLAKGPGGRHAYFLNTGTWTPSFAEGRRRLQTLGREVEFTFLKIARSGQGYDAELLRWNDTAGRADPQMVPPDTP